MAMAQELRDDAAAEELKRRTHDEIEGFVSKRHRKDPTHDQFYSREGEEDAMSRVTFIPTLGAAGRRTLSPLRRLHLPPSLTITRPSSSSGSSSGPPAWPLFRGSSSADVVVRPMSPSLSSAERKLMEKEDLIVERIEDPGPSAVVRPLPPPPQPVPVKRCEFCAQSFEHETDLADHTNRFHQGVKKFFCFTCHKRFKRKQSLENHVNMIHSGQRGS